MSLGLQAVFQPPAAVALAFSNIVVSSSLVLQGTMMLLSIYWRLALSAMSTHLMAIVAIMPP